MLFEEIQLSEFKSWALLKGFTHILHFFASDVCET